MQDKKNPESFAQQAVRASMYTPVIFFVVAVFSNSISKDSPFSGVMIGIILLLILAAGIIFSIIGLTASSKNASAGMKKRATIALLINGCILFIVLFIAIPNIQSVRRSDIEVEVRELAEKALEERIELDELVAKGEDIGDKSVGVLENSIERINKISENSSSTKAEFLKAVAESMEDLKEPLGKYNSSFSAFAKAGGIDVAEIQSVDDIEERLTLLKAFEKANEELDFFQQSLESRLRIKLSAVRQKDELEKLIQGWRQGFRPALIRKTRDADRRLIKNYRSALELYSNHWGKWSYDKESGMILTDDESVINGHNRAMEAINHIADEQEKLQKEILSFFKTRQNSSAQ